MGAMKALPRDGDALKPERKTLSLGARARHVDDARRYRQVSANA
jgi:hypothetical protein